VPDRHRTFPSQPSPSCPPLIVQHNLCLDAGGAILNDAMFRNHSCADYVARASKVVTLVDLAGA